MGNRVRLWLSFLGALGMLSIGHMGQSAMPLPNTVGPSTRLVAEGTILENELLYHAGDAQYASGQYPQAAVVRWAPIAEVGRYRVSLRARTEKWGDSSLVLQAWVPAEAGGIVMPTNSGTIPLTIASLPMNGYAFSTPGTWQTFTLDFAVEQGKPVTVGLMYVGKENCAAGKIQVENASLSLSKLALPVSLSWARPVKLRYHHAEAGALEVRVTNAGEQAQTVTLRPVILTETGERQPGKMLTMQVDAHATLPAEVPFAVPHADGGYLALCELYQGKTCIDQRGDVFAACDNPYRCMINGEGLYYIPYLLPAASILKLDGFQKTVLDHLDTYKHDCALAIESMRRAYITYYEFFAWAHDDAIKLTEDTDAPYLADQCSWPVSRQQLQVINGLMKQHGIAPAAYVNVDSFGWLGFDLLREHPEWYAMDKATGQPMASFNTDFQQKYLQHEQQSTYYPCLRANYLGKDPRTGQTYLDYHCAQLKASAAMYGWEAYRYDAGPLPTDVFPIVKDRLAHLHPPVAIGNNLGICCLGSEPSADWRTYTRDGSTMMEENIGFAFNNPSDPHRRWTDWIEYLRQGYSLTHANGGYYVYINGSGNWLATAIGFAMGAHPCATYTYQQNRSPYGDYARFMIQYGSYFWDMGKQFLVKPEQEIAVASPRALWWKPFASQRMPAPHHRQVIIPLFNPPAETEVIGTTGVGPVDGARVTFTPRPGEKVTAAWLLAPEPEAARLPLKMTVDRAQVTVEAPRFWGWTNVVFDCQE